MPTLALPAVIDTAAAVQLAGAIANAFPNPAKIVLDGGRVERIGVAGLQVLASAVRTADAVRRPLTIKAPSDALRTAAATAGFAPALRLDR